MVHLAQRLHGLPSFWADTTHRKRKGIEPGTSVEKASLIPDADGKPTPAGPSSVRDLFLQRISYVALVFILGNLIAVLCLHPIFSSARRTPPNPSGDSDSSRPRYLSLLVPSESTSLPSSTDVELCKTVLTAQVLRYPVPVVIPWGTGASGLPVAKKDRALDKASQILEYLRRLADDDDGIVILLDGPTTWFQLRPDVLLQRYDGLTRRARTPLRKRYGVGVTQTVLFTTQTHCDAAQIDLACARVPECAATRHDRPRCLAADAVIGPASTVRALVARAKTKLELGGAPNDLGKVFAEMYEEQNYQRELARHTGSKGTAWLWGGSHEAAAQASDADASEDGVGYEFGMGLDYSNELGAAMTLGDDQARWLVPETVPADIHASMPPFWTLSGAETDLPGRAGWSDIELLAVTDTGAIPAMVYRPGSDAASPDSSGSEESWARLWLSKYGRTLYTAVERVPSTVAASVVDEHGREQLFWNRQISYARAGVSRVNATGEEFVPWQDLCGADQVWREVFRDNLGPWHKKEWF